MRDRIFPALLPALLPALVAVLLWSCSGSKRDYSSWHNLPSEGWAYTDTVELMPLDASLSDNDTVAQGRIKLALRHSSDYPYANIWLELSYFGPDSTERRDTVKMVLADVYGRWLGSGIASGYQVETPAGGETMVDLHRPIRLRHILRVDTLVGVEQVGVLVDQ